MKKFINAYKRFKQLNMFGTYKFCWIPIDNNTGEGTYSCIEFFDINLSLIDINKCEIIQ